MVKVFEIHLDDLDQYNRRANVVFTGMPSSLPPDSQLKSTMISIRVDIDVSVNSSDVEDCHRVGKSERNFCKKTIIRIVNRNYCKKALINRIKLQTTIYYSKCSFTCGTKVFVYENVILAPEPSAWNAVDFNVVEGFILASLEMTQYI